MEASIKTLNSEIKKLEAKRDRNNKRKAELEKENTEILSDLKELNAIKEKFTRDKGRRFACRNVASKDFGQPQSQYFRGCP